MTGTFILNFNPATEFRIGDLREESTVVCVIVCRMRYLRGTSPHAVSHRIFLDHLLIDNDPQPWTSRHLNHPVPERKSVFCETVSPRILRLVQFQQWRICRKPPVRIRQN